MKRFHLLTLLGALTLTMACGKTEADKTPESEKPPVTTNGKILITYFTLPERDGVDASTGASRLVGDNGVIGHVQHLAGIIQEATGGELFEIRTEQTYPASHEPLVDQASAEKASGARPTLSTHIKDFDSYDVIFVGYPIWWSDMPMPMYSFFDEYNFEGKTIIPFTSHGGSGLAGTPARIKELEPQAVHSEAFTVSRNSVGNAKNDVLAWLRKLGYIK